MKKLLITGKSSYVGTSFQNWLRNYPDRYLIDSISLRDDSWKEEDFSGYDVVFHVVGIAHIKETRENAHVYYKINRDLAFEVAKKAKDAGVKQFIFLSSMSVYGIESGVIDENTSLKPKSNYGKSKLQAEELITTLEDEVFKVVIVRPPMIYGKNSKGNYTRLAKLAVRVPVFPNIENKRSMIYIDNLSMIIQSVIDNCDRGLLFPQNSEYVSTSKMVKLIAEAHGKKIRVTKLFNPLLNRMKKNGIVKKVFGDLIYEKKLSKYSDIQSNSLIGFEESIRLTED
ncbi:NAD-dependent epimerase/dehydratase family protein [Bacillus norwichensis]|uniref:NAD-dependent epimerase/dehydratase family protein n=1 Tax=Bacillus norwichensis TaxID=2762217 RepID=A0ABR8VHK7_9BACI|nr:NAD-dependent epimerase/dehydratase family protein [Bacillus norwichensis]MBD8004261.1 NAD-dependent epimerase/dehydratase family protein [Bacillus norwichensis]